MLRKRRYNDGTITLFDSKFQTGFILAVPLVCDCPDRMRI